MRQITKISMDNKNIEIVISIHAEERLHDRMKKSNINEWNLVGNIVMLGTKLIEYAEEHEEFAIIDNNLNFSVICGAEKVDDKNVKITIITIINKANIWVKDATSINQIN